MITTQTIPDCADKLEKAEKELVSALALLKKEALHLSVCDKMTFKGWKLSVSYRGYVLLLRISARQAKDLMSLGIPKEG